MSRRGAPVTALGLELVTMVVITTVALVKYGTKLDAAGFPTAFNAFLVMSTIGAFVISIVYAMLCVGGIMYFSRRKHYRAVVGAAVGLLTAGAGVLAQFVNGAAPVGDALWGRHLGLAVVVVVGAWLALDMATRADRVELAGAHALQHVEH